MLLFSQNIKEELIDIAFVFFFMHECPHFYISIYIFFIFF